MKQARLFAVKRLHNAFFAKPLTMKFFYYCCLIGISGCASQIDDPISNNAFQGPSLQQVRAAPASFTGQTVRWGGTIARVENQTGTTHIEVVELPLAGSGRPRDSNASAGRFIAHFTGFLDPVIYAAGKSLTVIGHVEAIVDGKIGDHRYRFPLVKAAQHRLWEKRKEAQIIYYREPFFYDPWFYRFHRRPYHKKPK